MKTAILCLSMFIGATSQICYAQDVGSTAHAQKKCTSDPCSITATSNDSVSGTLVNQRADSANVGLLEKELAVGTKQVRLDIVLLLEKLGMETDTPAPDKFPIIRDQAIIRALAVGGFAKDDAAESHAVAILISRCKPSDLAVFNDIYAASLQQLKGQYLNIATKAKTLEARQSVEKMALLPKWRNQAERREAFRIAQAALGNTQIEDEFINAAIQAENPHRPHHLTASTT